MNQLEKWQVDAFKALPLTFHCLAVEITNRCTAQCAICYQSAEKLNSLNAVSLPEDDVKLAITDASVSPYVYKRFHLAGGEAFLDMDKCINLFMHAKQVGFFEITATTNAFWAKSMSKARKISKILRQSGVTALEVSTDYWHQEYISPVAIDNCIRACKETNIKIILRILSTKKHPMGEVFRTLSPDSLRLSDTIVCGNVFLTGNAKKEVARNDVKNNSLNFPCYSALNLAINTYGGVTPCCAGLDQSLLNFGNIRNNSLSNILYQMNKSQIARILAYFGASYFIPILNKSGVFIKESNFSTACELCSSIFSDQNNISIIEEYIRILQKKAIQEAINYLKTR